MFVRFGKAILGIVMFLGLANGLAFAQTVNANALKAFQTSSGGAAANWTAGPNGSWEAAWAKEGQKMVYCYDQAGLLQQKKIVSTIGAFPQTINASITAAYPSAKVQAAYKVVDRSNQKFYEVHVANASNVDRMRYSLEGKPLGKTTVASAQPVAAQPTLTASATNPASKPTSWTSVKPATPAPAPAKPATPAAAPKPTPASQPMAMRGEAATTTKPAPIANDDLLEDDDLGDLLDDDDLGDLLNEDDSWDDIDLGDDLEDDSDLLDGMDDVDDLDLDSDLEDDEDGF